jgi:hypothetical protein
MSVTDLLSQCAALEVTLSPSHTGKLRVSPPGVLPNGIRAQLQIYKAALLRPLSAAPADVFSDEPCATCRSHERWQCLDGRLLCWVCLILDLAPMTPAPVMIPED